jgi:hypothetical protein
MINRDDTYKGVGVTGRKEIFASRSAEGDLKDRSSRRCGGCCAGNRFEEPVSVLSTRIGCALGLAGVFFFFVVQILFEPQIDGR